MSSPGSRAESYAELTPHLYRRWMKYGKSDVDLYPAHLGLVMEDVRVDYCRMRLPWRSEISQAFGVAHGGAVAGLLDSVLVPAIGAGYDEPVRFSTVALSMQFIGALKDEDAVAEGWITQRGRSVIFGEAEVLGAASGRLVARGQLTFSVSGPKPVVVPGKG